MNILQKCGEKEQEKRRIIVDRKVNVKCTVIYRTTVCYGGRKADKRRRMKIKNRQLPKEPRIFHLWQKIDSEAWKRKNLMK